MDAGIIALRLNEGSNGEEFEYYYSYGDHLGSTLSLTDNNGELILSRSYDAWGRKRSAEDWINYHVEDQELSWFYRGYTGHEMLMDLDLINMNGRLYDPLVARMLSVDEYAGLDGSSQSYNRYSYVYNNPLMYTDPTGEHISLTLGRTTYTFGFKPIALNIGRAVLNTGFSTLRNNCCDDGSILLPEVTIVATHAPHMSQNQFIVNNEFVPVHVMF